MATRNGTPGNDTLTGTQFADSLFGFAGNDSLLGLGGNDTLDGGIGIDTLIGGAGDDTYIVDRATDTITEAANSGIDTVQSSVSYTLGNNLENLTLTGSALNGTGNSLNNTIIGNDADNTLNGIEGNDTLIGRDGSDTLYGGDGNDSLNGSATYYGALPDILYGGDGNDILDGGSYDILAFDGGDTLYGGNGNDTLYGDDSRFGNADGDTLDGGNGNDTYLLRSTGDTLTEAANSGIDTVIAADFTLGNNIENLRVLRNGTGNSLNNIITGSAAQNILSGQAGNDKLNGGAGNDDLFGSSGGVGERDTLTGGTEIDTFFLGEPSQVLYDDFNSATAGTGDYALITDFNTSDDVIKLNGRRSDYILKQSPSGLPLGTAIYQNKPTGEPDELIAIVQGSSGLNLNGNYFRFTANEINLSTLYGSNGFEITGIKGGDFSGTSVSDAGDVNGDGFSDLIIGAPGASESYVVFGKAGNSGSLNLRNLNGSNGFKISGIDRFDYLGGSVSSASDVNGDGFSDLIIGATGADPNGQNRAGESYVVFGKAGGFSPSLNVSTLNGSNGFKINGIDANDFSGGSVSDAGDVNGDGFNDLLIGAIGRASFAQDAVGESYVVFGKAEGFEANLNLSALDGSNGFKINGIDNLDYNNSLSSVSSAGDINGDGFDDIIIGAPTTSYNFRASSYSYVVFGKAEEFSATLNLSTLDGSNGFKINGISSDDSTGDDLGSSVSSAGDINGDGFDDIIIGGPTQNTYRYYSRNDPGQSYVVFGKEGGFAPNLNVSTLDGSNGFVINGIDANELSGDVGTNDKAGTSVSSAGDINGDGFDDLLIGAIDADPNGQNGAGESYVVFGKAGGFGASLNLSDINGSNGFLINGIDAGDNSGNSVSGGGDVNGDGFDDIIVGASAAESYGGQNAAGESYVIFGRDFTGKVNRAGTAGNDTLTGTAGDDILVGGRGNDRLIGGGGSDVAYGGAGDDILSFGRIDRRLNGGSGTDTLRIDTSGINMDLRAIANNKITEFELIDITGTGNNSLNFTRLDLLDLSNTTNQLIVNGNTGDTAISTGQGWTAGGTTTVDSILYNRYTVGAATLLVDTDITQTIT